MLVFVEIVNKYFFLNLIFSFKERRGLQRQNVGRQFWISANLILCQSARSRLFSRISRRKRIFQKNHFCLFIRGLGGLDSLKKCQKSCDTATLMQRGFLVERGKGLHKSRFLKTVSSGDTLPISCRADIKNVDNFVKYS